MHVLLLCASCELRAWLSEMSNIWPCDTDERKREREREECNKLTYRLKGRRMKNPLVRMATPSRRGFYVRLAILGKEMHTFFALHNNLARMFGRLRADGVSRHFHRHRTEKIKKEKNEMANQVELEEVQELVLAAYNFLRVFGDE